MTILFAAVFPLGLYFLSWILSKKLNKLENKRRKRNEKEGEGKPIAKQLSKHLTAVLVIELIVFLMLSIISEYLLFHDEGSSIPVFIMLPAAALPFGAVLAKHYVSNEKIGRFLKKTAICALALIAVEVVLFNGKSFTTGSTDAVINTNAMLVGGAAERRENDILITGDASITLSNLPDDITGLILDTEQEQHTDSRLFRVRLSMTDDNLSKTYTVVQEKYTMGYDHDLTLSFHPYGNVHALQLGFTSITKPITIHSIRAVSAIPFAFSVIRYLVLLAAAVLLIAVKEFRLYKITYQNKKAAHRILAAAMVVLCTCSAVFFFRPEQTLMEYDSTVARLDDPYAMTFDAFQKGQVHLDCAADPALEELENVYDNSLRQEAGVLALWDFAYYEGNYYSYFGVTPVITFYYPCYFLTGKLPTVAMAVAFFGTLTILCLCMTILAAVRLLVPRPNLLLLLASMPAAACSLGIYMILNAPSLYTLPNAAGLCYLFLCLWMGLWACSTKRKVPRLIMLFTGGVSLALCVAARPGIALGAAILIPLFLGILLKKKEQLAYRLGQASCFVVPLIIGGCAVMWYNNARFGSPFDFGAAYQLTVSDIHANTVKLSSFPSMLYHYFFQMPRPKQSFPFMEHQFCVLNNYSAYTYVADSVGALTYPMILLGAAMIPVAFRKKGRLYAHGVTRLQRNAIPVICVAAALFIGWINFCLAGVSVRYVVDLMPLLVILSVITILRSTGNPLKNKYRYILSGICMAASCSISWLLLVGIQDGELLKRCPNLYDTLENLLIFWQ